MRFRLKAVHSVICGKQYISSVDWLIKDATRRALKVVKKRKYPVNRIQEKVK